MLHPAFNKEINSSTLMLRAKLFYMNTSEYYKLLQMDILLLEIKLSTLERSTNLQTISKITKINKKLSILREEAEEYSSKLATCEDYFAANISEFN